MLTALNLSISYVDIDYKEIKGEGQVFCGFNFWQAAGTGETPKKRPAGIRVIEGVEYQWRV